MIAGCCRLVLGRSLIGRDVFVAWRRGRDSNPRKRLLSLQWISNPPLSTTQPPLRAVVLSAATDQSSGRNHTSRPPTLSSGIKSIKSLATADIPIQWVSCLTSGTEFAKPLTGKLLMQRFKQNYCVGLSTLAALMAAMWCFAPICSADSPGLTIVVDGNAGDDGAGDGTAAAPFRTPQRALQTIGFYYSDLEMPLEVILRPGRYVGSLDLPPTNGRLTVRASAPANQTVMIEGGGTVRSGHVVQGVTFAGGDGVTLEAGGTIRGCRVERHSGPGIRITPPAAGWWRGETEDAERTARVEDCVVTQNQGGGIRVSGVRAEINGSKITGNLSADDGGGVWIVAADAVSIRDTIINDNLSAGSGGGIFCSFSELTLRDSYLGSNLASSSGGGLAAVGGTVSCLDTDIAQNGCGILNSGGGGGISLVEVEAELEGNVLWANESHYGGGVDVLVEHSTVEVWDNVIAGNLATVLGGGLCAEGDGLLWIDSNRIDTNLAPEAGAIATEAIETAESDNAIYDNLTLLGDNPDNEPPRVP